MTNKTINFSIKEIKDKELASATPFNYLVISQSIQEYHMPLVGANLSF